MLRRPVCWSRAQDTSEGWTKVALETPAVTELKTQFSVTQPQWMPHPGKRPPLQPPSSSYPRGPPGPVTPWSLRCTAGKHAFLEVRTE